jgi:hypothetical protein
MQKKGHRAIRDSCIRFAGSARMTPGNFISIGRAGGQPLPMRSGKICRVNEPSEGRA